MRAKTILNQMLKQIYLLSPFQSLRMEERMEKAIWFGRFYRWKKDNPCAESNWRPAVYHDAAYYDNRLKGVIRFLEFGTYQGRSIRWWLKLNQDPRSRFVGFDSFIGLPEAWEGRPQGHFSTAAQVPSIEDQRCSFRKGWFYETLPDFLAQYDGCDELQVFHLDADLFSSTLYVLNHIGPLLKPGDYIIFDEFHIWMDEFRAFILFQKVFPVEYKVVSRSPDWSQVVIRITKR